MNYCPQAQRPAILVVDDTAENLYVLNAALKGDYLVRPAPNGRVALQIAASERLDLILLDIMMPEMDGYEVLQRLQAHEETRHIPVIFVTALAEMDDEVKGLQLGAVDYITKPIQVPIVKARVRLHLALREAQRRIEAQNQLLLAERNLIEDVIIRMRSGNDLDERYLRYLASSVDRTNGDVLFSVFTPDGRQWLLVGDVAGHGPAAAIATPLISHVFYQRGQAGGAIEAMLVELNAVMNQRLPLAIYMPYCLVEVSADRRHLSLWNGGLPGCAILGGEEVACIFDAASFPLGLVESHQVVAGQIQVEFPADARLCLFTDGLSELPDGRGMALGADRVTEMVAALGDGDLAALWPQLEAHCGTDCFPDDITLAELWASNPAPAAKRSERP